MQLNLPEFHFNSRVGKMQESASQINFNETNGNEKN